MARTSDTNSAFLAFGLPSFIWLALFFVAPLGIIFLYSFGENISLTQIETTWTLENYRRILDPQILELLWRSLWLALISTIICLVVGLPMAMLIATASPTAKPWLLLVIMLPFWTNLLIRTYALLNILGTRGRLNQLLGWLHEQTNALFQLVGFAEAPFIGANFKPLTFLGTPGGVVFGIVYVSLPFAILPIYSTLERMDRSLLEASMDLGANQWQTIRRVLIPLAMPGILTAAVITFIPAIGQFLTPDLLGRGQVDMIANVIERQFKKANDWPFGSAISLTLLYATFILLALRAFGDAARSKNRRD
ncbi:MAG: spermidine/putrescine ABC transporter permease [Gammaproteobacteria bacterium]|nr:MAG: spermidine/putrescine ABC transporter permease [Gammaproteobacteria bacterium]